MQLYSQTCTATCDPLLLLAARAPTCT
jgi:hypothetical protein